MNSKVDHSVAWSQEVAHGEGHDYTVGSPHLSHISLRDTIHGRIGWVLDDIVRTKGRCDVLEIGAGHGSFTESVLAAGGSATVTEMSQSSAAYLRNKFAGNPNVRVLYDADGAAPLREDVRYDVILFISVIHHIPDYIGAITALCDTVLNPGGAVVTFQDPLWYPRMSRSARVLSRGSYFAWRLTRGDVRRGLGTRWRRLRGVYSESHPSDLTEYHVMRQGVDEVALLKLFRQRFAYVDLETYFSTQSEILHEFGEDRFPPNTFGITARGHLVAPESP